MNITTDMAALLPELQGLREPKSLQELMSQIAIIGKGMERCEKMLQVLAMGGEGEEIAKYSSMYKELISWEQSLQDLKPALLIAERTQSAEKKPWWRFW